jgi:sortase A
VDKVAAPIGRDWDDSAVSRRWRTVARGTGQTLITAGLVILLFVAYELWWTGLTTRHDQHRLLNALRQQWGQSGGTATGPGPTHPGRGAKKVSIANPPLGSGIAILRIPRLGKNYSFVVVQGTSTADLIEGPGHYVGTAMPGQVGNFYVAGHRTTYLHPFYNINELRPGDPIVIETRTMWFTYTVENIPGTAAKYQEIVSPTDFAVTYPVPDQPNPNAAPTQRVLTFTSCNPRYSASQRIVVHALLTGHQLKSAGLPPALAGDRLSGS